MHEMLNRITYNYYKMKKSGEMLCKFSSLRESCDRRYLKTIIVITLNMWLTLSKSLLRYYLTPFSKRTQELSHLVGRSLSRARALNCPSCTLIPGYTLGHLRRFQNMWIPESHSHLTHWSFYKSPNDDTECEAWGQNCCFI